MSAPSEMDMTERVVHRLGRRVNDLQVLVGDRGLVLRGRSYTWFGKLLAQQAAQEVTGLCVAANEIEVTPPPPWDDGPE